MKDSIEIWSDLTVSDQGHEISIKAEGRTIGIHLSSPGAFLKYARDLTRLPGQFRSFKTIDRLLTDRGIGVVVYIGLFHVTVLGAGVSKFLRYIFALFLRKKKNFRPGFHS